MQNIGFQNIGLGLDRFRFRSRGDDLVLGVLEPLVPQAARVAEDLALARQLQAEIDSEGLTYRQLAERHGWSRMKVCRVLPLVRLAPDIQAEVSQLTTTVAGEPLDRDTLLWVAEEPDHSSQRARFEALAQTWRMLREQAQPTKADDGPGPSFGRCDRELSS